MITAEEWTAAHPEGTPVKAWPGTRDDIGQPISGTVRSGAWDLCGSLVAMVTGRSGGIHTAHIECDAKCDVCKRAWADERAKRRRNDRKRAGAR